MADGSRNSIDVEDGIALTLRKDHAGDDSVIRVALILIPRFSMLSLSSFLEAAEKANQLSRKRLFEYSFFASSGAVIPSQCGLSVEVRPIAELVPTTPDLVLVFGDSVGTRFKSQRTEATLRQLKRHGVRIGGVGSACFILARAGVLQDRRCAVPWYLREAYAENFSPHYASENLYLMDRDLVTCAGGVGMLDLTLALISRSFGNELAASIADELMYGAIRSPGDTQSHGLVRRVKNPLVVQLARLMEESVEPLVSPRDLARRLCVSHRQMERLFSHHLGTTPSRYQKRVRLNRAQRMLRHTTLTVSEIAIACGFQSLSHFSKVYRQTFGLSPRRDRILA